MSKNQCPYCGDKITYWQKLKPALSFNNQFIICINCESKISDFWVKGAIGVALGAGSAGLLAGRGENAIQSIAGIGLVFLIAMLAAPLLIGLKECNEIDLAQIRKERLDKEMQFSFKRAAVLAAGAVAFMAAALWLLQPPKI